MDVTQKSFAFPHKHNIPLYYVSASDGTNVVKVLFFGVVTTCILAQECYSVLLMTLGREVYRG
jgi:hypothetical protein